MAIEDDEGTGAAGRSSEQPVQLGRKRDHTRDADILDAAIAVLAEIGYDRMTMDMVALRARAGKATMYRRWPSKAELVLEAIAHMKGNQVDHDDLPTTGNLRDDLLALFKPQSFEDEQLKMRAMAGLSSMLSQHREFAEAANAAIVEPWAAVNRLLISRAIERGEVAAVVDVDTLAQVIPSMSAYRTLILRKPLDRAFLTSMIDAVLLPALRNPA